jgi:hypothetical protein
VDDNRVRVRSGRVRKVDRGTNGGRSRRHGNEEMRVETEMGLEEVNVQRWALKAR